MRNNIPTQLSLKKITKPGQKFWFGSITLPTTSSSSEQFSIIINDLRGNIYIYNNKGNLLQECQIGQIIILPNNDSIVFSEFLTSTGLQIKADPGIRTVYLSFFLLMLSTYVSFISYSQIWGTEILNNYNLAGNSNRAVLFFQSEFRKIIRKSKM